MSHQRTRSPDPITARDTDEYNKLSNKALKAKYDEVYSKFATYVATYPRERLPEHHDKRGFPKIISDWVFSADRVQLVNEIIDMEARMRELDAGAAQVAHVKDMQDEEERRRNAAEKKGHFTEKELADQRMQDYLKFQHYEHFGKVDEIQRQQNELLGFGRLTNPEVAIQQGTFTEDTAPPGAVTRYIWQRGRDRYKDKGGRTKRAKKAKRSHRYRHLKQRSRTRKH